MCEVQVVRARTRYLHRTRRRLYVNRMKGKLKGQRLDTRSSVTAVVLNRIHNRGGDDQSTENSVQRRNARRQEKSISVFGSP